MPTYLVVGVAALAALGALIGLAGRAVPAGKGSVERTGTSQRDESHSGSPTPFTEKDRAGAHDLQSPDNKQTPKRSEVVHYRYKVIKTYPHDRRFFTQGLVYEDGFIYEGTGLYGQSAIYKRDLQTGKIIKSLRLPDKHFGEGITLLGDKLIELTWQSHVGFVYTKDTFTPLREFKYAGEGWGLTHDDKRLILSDGTAILRFLDPNTFAETGRLEVRDQGRPVPRLNELEFIADRVVGGETGTGARPGEKGQGSRDEAGGGRLETGGAYGLRPTVSGLIFANIWPTDRIVIIDPQTGRVTGWIDLSGLYTPPADDDGDSVLNGIAYLPQTKHLLVTGKLWPRLYEIELVKQTP